VKKIPLFKPKFRVDEVLSEIKECLDIGWTGIGYKTDQFEKLWCEYTQFKNCHFLNSATAGLHLAIRIFKDECNWSDGDEVIAPALTFVSTNHAILYESLTPVFSDIDSSLCLDPVKLQECITPKTKAVIYVGIGGNAANYKKIVEICKNNNLKLILDAAHMAGTKWLESDTHIGSEADCSVFSYQAVKNCPSSDAGAICFKDEKLDVKVRKLSWLGISENTFNRAKNNKYKWDYDIDEIGYKYNGNSISAAMSIVSLRYLDKDNERRREISNYYTSSLKSNDRISTIVHDDAIISSRHLYQIIVNDRDKFIEHMESFGISCGVHYKPNNRFSIFKKYDNRELNYTNSIADKIVSLPLHVNLSDQDIDKIVNSINKFF
jgi:dTDP-4-amino-4,6-dideoxygalactose transaminase